MDLQSALPKVLPLERSPLGLHSLQYIAKKVLGLRMRKDKRLQAFDWETRPLPTDQLRYAAADAVVLVHMYRRLGISPLTRIPVTRASA